jgi:hypothetical protein
VNEPLSNPEARALIRSILAAGTVGYSRHAEEQMEARGISELDVTNALRGGHVIRSEWEGTWRYTVQTQRFSVVVAFSSEDELVIVTAWRNQS